MAEKPIREFGTRKPVAIQPAQPVKRGQVALLLMGTLAVGSGAYALMPSENCIPNQPGMAAPQGGVECRPRGSSSGGSGGSSSRSSFYSGNSSASHSSASATTSESHSGNVMRGGFGGLGSHFSGGG